MKKLLIIALILLLLAPSSLGAGNSEHSRNPEFIVILNPHIDCEARIITFSTNPPSMECFNFDF